MSIKFWIPIQNSGPAPVRRSEVNSTAARRRAAGIMDLIQTDILPQSRWIGDPGVIIIHRMCMSSTSAVLCGTKSMHWSYRIKIYTTLRSNTSASLSTFVRERNPHIGLQRYVTESQLIVTTLLIDRSWAFGSRVANFVLFLASIPNTEIYDAIQNNYKTEQHFSNQTIGQTVILVERLTNFICRNAWSSFIFFSSINLVWHLPP
jgi:hypothetical protein